MKGRRKKELQHKMRMAGVRHFKYTGPVKAGPKIKPNEPCPCGSGKKFKRCCRPKWDEEKRAKKLAAEIEKERGKDE